MKKLPTREDQILGVIEMDGAGKGWLGDPVQRVNRHGAIAARKLVFALPEIAADQLAYLKLDFSLPLKAPLVREGVSFPMLFSDLPPMLGWTQKISVGPWPGASLSVLTWRTPGNPIFPPLTSPTIAFWSMPAR